MKIERNAKKNSIFLSFPRCILPSAKPKVRISKEKTPNHPHVPHLPHLNFRGARGGGVFFEVRGVFFRGTRCVLSRCEVCSFEVRGVFFRGARCVLSRYEVRGARYEKRAEGGLPDFSGAAAELSGAAAESSGSPGDLFHGLEHFLPPSTFHQLGVGRATRAGTFLLSLYTHTHS